MTEDHPYGQQVYSGTWVPNTTDFDTFLNAVKTSGSPMYTSRGNNGNMDSTYYANDCSSFVSYCYGLPRMTTWSFGYSSQFTKVSGNSIYNAEPGDSFNLAGSHIEIITAMNYDDSGNLVSVEVSEQTPPKARTIIYTPEQVQKLINQGYTLIRYKNRASVGSPKTYAGYESDREDPVKVTYSLEEPAEILLEDRKGDGSAYNLTVTGLEKYSKTKYVAAVWSKENGQDDLKWITLDRQTNADYTTTLKQSDFKHNGSFYVHLYKMGPIQEICLRTTEFVWGADQEPEQLPETTVSASVDGTAVTVTAENLYLSGGISQILVPTWSSQNSQDDIRWEKASYKKASASASVTIDAENYLHYGEFISHVYAVDRSGGMHFMGAVTYTVEEPDYTYNEITSTFDENTGAFTASISHPKAEGGSVTAVQIPTWSEKNQKDIIWYKASKKANGTWVVSGNISKHNGLGTYHCHVYGTVNGKLTYLGQTGFTASASVQSFSAEAGSDGMHGTISATKLKTPAAFSKVYAAVWSQKNGQDDLVWYTMTGNTGDAVKAGQETDLSAAVNLKKHKTDGSYSVHLYGVTASGTYCFITSTEMQVNSTASAAVTVADETEKDGRVSLTIEVQDSNWSWTEMRVPVWCSPDQSDIVWYTAKKQQNGSWAVEIDSRNHKNHTGTYQIHVYLNYSNGVFGYIGRSTAQVA